jgi:hypothetical protein
MSGGNWNYMQFRLEEQADDMRKMLRMSSA